MNDEILIIDDNPLDAEVLLSRLRRDGYHVQYATNGLEGLAILAERSIKLLILDLDMPEMDGIQVLQELNRRQRYPRVPVLILSANSLTQRKVEAIENGADDFLAKPVEYPFLKVKLEKLIPPQLAVEELASGQKFAQYRLGRVLGVGGMAKVFQATDNRLGREVALKIMLLATPALAKRFLQEAYTLSQVSHPNLPFIYEVGEKPLPFLSMELVDGVELSKGSWSLPQIIEMIAETADTIQYMHQQGILHRDIKPANLIRTSNGQVKVLDFGLAKLLKMNERLTQSGEVLGTPTYMAPENFNAASDAVDFQSDVYSLTVTLYELLTGDPPFKSNHIGQLLQQIMSEPAPELGLAFPLGLQNICSRGMAKKKSERFATCAELATALRSLRIGINR